MTRVEIRLAPCGSVEVVVAMDGAAAEVSIEQLASTLARHPIIALSAASKILSERVGEELARARGERPCE
jgi:hypothetical protein